MSAKFLRSHTRRLGLVSSYRNTWWSFSSSAASDALRICVDLEGKGS